MTAKSMLLQWYLISAQKNSLFYYSNTQKYIMLPALGDKITF